MASGMTDILNFFLSIYSGGIYLKNLVSDTGITWASLTIKRNLGRTMKINKIVICKNKYTFNLIICFKGHNSPLSLLTSLH